MQGKDKRVRETSLFKNLFRVIVRLYTDKFCLCHDTGSACYDCLFDFFYLYNMLYVFVENVRVTEYNKMEHCMFWEDSNL